MFSKVLLLLLSVAVYADPVVDGTHNVTDPDDVESRRKGCICVKPYQCKNGVIITDGANLLDARKESATPDAPGAEPKRGQCQGSDVCCWPPRTSAKNTCGKRGSAGGVDSRIMAEGQSRETEPGEFAWQGAILQPVKGKNIFKCGCVLINSLYAITAAHCVPSCRDNPSSYVLRFGVWDTREEGHFQDVGLTKCTIHPKFEEDTLKNDIAVLSMKSPGVKYSSDIQPVCLPFYNKTYTGKKCIVTGWGKDSWDEGQFSSVLKMVTVPIQSHQECQRMLRTTRLGSFFVLDNSSFVCAGGFEGEDACKGDGGGPLVCAETDGYYSVVGLVSWGINCGLKDVPGVYVNVATYLNWIVSVTKQHITTYWSQT